MIADHKLQMCLLCIEHKHAFPSEQRIYSQAEYENHLRRGDKDGSEGHPSCEFCKQRYYDKTALFVHLERDHFKCHICEKLGIQFRYYSDYANLEDHFRTDHVICEEPACIQKRFVVFANELEYTSHLINYHPHLVQQQSRKTISLQFGLHGSRERHCHEEDDPFASSSSMLDFDGGVSGRARNGRWQVQLPPSGRDPREENRTAAAADNYSSALFNSATAIAEEFPALQISEEAAGMRNMTKGNPRLGQPRQVQAAITRIPASWGGGFKTDKRLAKKSTSSAVEAAPQSVTSGLSLASSSSSSKKVDDSARKSGQYASIAEQSYRPPKEEDFPSLVGGRIDVMRSAVAQEQHFPRPPSPPLAAKSEILDFGRNIKVKVKSLTSKKSVQNNNSTEMSMTASVSHVAEKPSTTIEKKVNSTKASKKSSDLSKAISSMGLGIAMKTTKKPTGISGAIPAKNDHSTEKAHETSDIANTLKGLKNELRQPKVSSLPPNSVAAFKEAEKRASDQPPPPPPGLSINHDASVRIGTWVRVGGASQTLASSMPVSGPAVKLSAAEYPSLSGR